MSLVVTLSRDCATPLLTVSVCSCIHVSRCPQQSGTVFEWGHKNPRSLLADSYMPRAAVAYTNNLQVCIVYRYLYPTPYLYFSSARTVKRQEFLVRDRKKYRGYRIFSNLRNLPRSPRDLRTQRDLPPVCGHLIQVNRVSLARSFLR
jgi:hypothetical protein